MQLLFRRHKRTTQSLKTPRPPTDLASNYWRYGEHTTHTLPNFSTLRFDVSLRNSHQILCPNPDVVRLKSRRITSARKKKEVCTRRGDERGRGGKEGFSTDEQNTQKQIQRERIKDRNQLTATAIRTDTSERTRK